MDKATLRSAIAVKRDAMRSLKAKQLSAKICSGILGIPAVKDSRAVGIYVSLRNEVVAEILLRPLRAMDKKVYAPVVLSRGDMKFTPLESLDETGKRARMREPTANTFAKEGEIDAFIVPGVAFDLRGFRIGWGGGHYDRFFSKNKSVVKIGAAYDFQIVERIDSELHDIRMDFVVTEKRILKL